jgi:hypothetical protein
MSSHRRNSWKFNRRFIRRRYLTDGLTAVCVLHETRDFDKNLKIMHQRDCDQRVVGEGIADYHS